MSRRDGDLTRLSKSLSWLLRHNAEWEGFSLLEGGYLPVDDILRHARFIGWTEADVRRVVDTCEKQRFSLAEMDTGQLMIRANQGSVPDPVGCRFSGTKANNYLFLKNVILYWIFSTGL